jgi:hypothetical protein
MRVKDAKMKCKGCAVEFYFCSWERKRKFCTPRCASDAQLQRKRIVEPQSPWKTYWYFRHKNTIPTKGTPEYTLYMQLDYLLRTEKYQSTR